MNFKPIAAIAALVLIVSCIFAGFQYMETHEALYYTQVDNTKIRELTTEDDMKYEYTLDSYNQDGRKKTFRFKTSRVLRDSAYLALNIRALGVHKWEEVQYDNLPQKVKNVFQP